MGQYSSTPADTQIPPESEGIESPYEHVPGISYGAIIGPGVRKHAKKPYEFPSIPLPLRVDLRDTTCAPYFEPFTQGEAYSCTSDAVAAAFMCSERRQKLPDGARIQPSVLFNYFYARAQMGPQMAHRNAGATLENAIVAMHQGVATNQVWPQSKGWDEKPSEEAQRDALQHSLTTAMPLEGTLENLKRTLAHGYPFVFVFAVTPVMDRWFKSREKQVESQFIMAEGELVPRNIHMGHAVLAIGYDDKYFDGVFIVRNSWGPAWGDGGHFFMPYSLVTNPDISTEYSLIERICSNPKNTRTRCVEDCSPFYSHIVCTS